MLRKVFIIGGAVAGAIIGYLRTENFVTDVSGVFWGVILGAYLAYFVCNIVENLLDRDA